MAKKKSKEAKEAQRELLKVGGKVSDLLAETVPKLVKKMASDAKGWKKS